MSLINLVAYKTKIGRRRNELNLRRRDVFIWAAVILFSNQLFYVVKEPRSATLEKLVSDLCAVGIFQYMAWFAHFRLLGSSDPKPAARWRDCLIAAALCLLILLPTSRIIWVAAAGISIYLWIFDGGDIKLRAAGIVLAALSVQELWGRIFFDLFAFPLLRVETAVVGAMLAAARRGTVWQDNVITGPSGHGIVVYTGCSSFHNVSLAMLCWLTVSQLRNQHWRCRDLVIGGVVCGTMIILNLVRLSLMAWNIDLFTYWHDGMGAEIFGIGASLATLLISLYGSGGTGRAG